MIENAAHKHSRDGDTHSNLCVCPQRRSACVQYRWALYNLKINRRVHSSPVCTVRVVLMTHQHYIAVGKYPQGEYFRLQPVLTTCSY